MSKFVNKLKMIFEGKEIDNIYHGGVDNLTVLDVEKTKAKIFGNAIYFTDNFESAKRYAFERYGKEGAVYKAKIKINNYTSNTLEFKNNSNYDGLIFQLKSTPGETNYAVKTNEQVLSLEKIS
jgi:hypothetical protein